MADFTSIVCIGGHLERPFQAEGDKDHKIFHFDCLIYADDYDSLALTTSITNASAASVAGLDQYPIGLWPTVGDGTCYFVGDSTPVPYQGAIVRFTRSFANVPGARTRGLGSFSFTFPAFRRWSVDQANGGSGSKRWLPAFHQNEIPFPEEVIRESFTEAAPAKISYSYTYATAIESVTPADLFFPIWKSNTGSFNNSTYYGDYYEQRLASMFLVDGDRYDPTDIYGPYPNGYEFGVGPSMPNVTDYKNNYIDQLYVNASSTVKSYMGNIFVVETISVLAR